MKILCFIDRYYPDSSAGTVCCDNLMDYFKSQGHQVDFVTIKWSIEDKDYEFYNGSNVIKLSTFWMKVLKKKGKKYNAKKWTDLPRPVRLINSIPYRIKCAFKRTHANFVSLDCLNYDYIMNTIQKINTHYDVLITFTMPASFQIIGNELMKRNLADKWYPIFLDAFVYNRTLKKSKINYRKKIMEKTLKNATHIFMVDGIKSANLKQGYDPKYHENTTEIFIPNLKEMKLPEVSKDTEKIRLIYAGYFYKTIRNPEKMLEILSNLSENVEVKLFFKDCEDIVEEKKNLFTKCKLITSKLIPHQKCLEEISKADILINLGNTITNQMPSKILEYISFGKPIINFYFTENDMCLPILEKYPLVLNINVNKFTDNDIDIIKKFIKNNKGLKLDFEEATNNLTEYRSNVIASKICKIIENKYN